MEKLQKTILLACDHAGYDLKESIKKFLEQKKLVFKDFGTHNKDRCDYPDYAEALCKAFNHQENIGILVCGTGTGISIAANKFKGIRCSVCNNYYIGKASIDRDNPNMIAMGERVIGEKVALEIVELFLEKKVKEDNNWMNNQNHNELGKLEEKYLKS